MIEFYKYQGTGNDFILIDNRSLSFKSDKVLFAKKWCDRRFGVGSDGIIFIELSLKADFYVDFYNPDGSKSFCGNGSRCAVSFARFLGMIPQEKITFDAIDGLHDAIIEDNDIRIKMKDVTEIQIIGDDFFMHTGSPHYISYDENSEKNILIFGQKVRYSDQYQPSGTNVNLIKTIGRNHIEVRTYERGVEDETFSCGTGVTACALSYALKNNLNSGQIITDVKGGRLLVNFEKHESGFKNIWLQGPAEYVYQGIIHDKTE